MQFLAALALASTIAGPTAQPPATKPDARPAPAAVQDDFAALVRAIDGAHRGAAAPASVQSFRAQVRIEPRRHDEEKVTVDLDVDFQAPRALRTAVREKGVRVERGYDPQRGAWVRNKDGTTPLQGPGHEQEAERVINDVRLCGQVLRFLDPGKLISDMADRAPLRRQELEVTRRLRYADCHVVEGTLERFPTYTLGTEGRARVTVYVHGETHRLLAVTALPLDEAGKPRDRAEFILLDDFKPVQDVQLPGKLTVWQLSGPGKELLLTVHILGIELGSRFAADHFARPR